jgi:hypothetical protein
MAAMDLPRKDSTMFRTARRGLLAAAIVGALAAAPAQADDVQYCPADPVEYLADGSFIYSNEAAGAGCVTARVYPNGAASLYRVVVAPGWTYKVKSSGGTTNRSRVEVAFENRTTGERVNVRMEAGKTVIK